MTAPKEEDGLDAIKNLEASAKEAQARVLDSAEEARKLVKEACDLAMSELSKSAQSDDDKRNLNGSYRWDSNGGTISYRVKELEDEVDSLEKRLDTVSNKIEKMQLSSQVYYSTISPEDIRNIVELTHKNEISISEMRRRYDEFIADRIIKLAETNKAIEDVKSTAAAVKVNVMERVDKDKIRNQQYVIGIVVGLIVTVITSLILVQLHV